MKNGLKILLILSFIIIFCIIFILIRGSFSASSVQVNITLDQIIEDVNNYYTENENNHKMKVSITDEEITSKASLINQYKDLIEKVKRDLINKNAYNISNFYNKLKTYPYDDEVVNVEEFNKTSSMVNILTGYVYMKDTMDKLFYDSEPTGEDAPETIEIKVKEGNEQKKYFYAITPISDKELNNYRPIFIKTARKVKTRVENFILLYSVTGDIKYYEAMRQEILKAVRWENKWQSTEPIDTSEIAYVVSLGYDFMYDNLQDEEKDEEKIEIENRLLESVLLYCSEFYGNSINNSHGNYKQGTNSGIGVVVLSLLDSSKDGKIKVTEIDNENKRIAIMYPVKNKTGIEYKNTLMQDKNNKELQAYIADEIMYDLLTKKDENNKYIYFEKDENGNYIEDENRYNYISLKTLYSAVITKTLNSLPEILKSDNTYIDGSYTEGKNFYLYGMRFFSYYLATLNNTFGEIGNNYVKAILDFEDKPEKSKAVFNNIVLNPIYIANAKGDNLNYSNASENLTSSDEDDLLYLANLNATESDNSEIAKIVYDYRKRTGHIWNFYSIMWYDEKYETFNNMSNDFYEKVFNDNIYKNSVVERNLDRLAVASFRKNFTDNSSIFVAMKGGDSKANHSHLDLGSYVFDALGTRWISEAGIINDGSSKGNFNRTYLKWQYYAARAEAHSTIVINQPSIIDTSKGSVLAADQWIDAYGEFTKFASSNNSSIATIDLTDAYNKNDNDNIKEDDNIGNNASNVNNNIVNRGIKLFNDKKYMLVQDEVSLENVTEYFSFLNINITKDVNINVRIINNDDEDCLENDKCTKAILTDSKNNQVKLYLISNNRDVEFKMIDDITNGTGLLNDFIGNPDNNENVSLSTNANYINHKKLVVYLPNNKATNVDMKVGVFFVPLYDENSDIDQEMLELTDLDDWYIPEKPVIKIMNENNEVNENATINGNAIITINGTKKDNEVIKYSLDSGNTWNEYNDNDSEDVARRTITKSGKNTINILAVVDDGRGVQSDTTEISNFTFTILEKDYIIFNKNLKINEDKKIIWGFKSDKTMTTFLKNIQTDGTIKIKSNDGISFLSGNDSIKTGDTLIIELSKETVSYTLSKPGDVSKDGIVLKGDGKVNQNDASLIAKHLIDRNLIVGDEYIIAADLNNDSQIKINDLLLLMKSLTN